MVRLLGQLENANPWNIARLWLDRYSGIYLWLIACLDDYCYCVIICLHARIVMMLLVSTMEFRSYRPNFKYVLLWLSQQRIGIQAIQAEFLVIVVLSVLGHIGRIASTNVQYRALSIACLISNARMLCGKEGYVSMSLRGLAGRFHKACSVRGGCQKACFVMLYPWWVRHVSLRQGRLLEYVPTWLGREVA